MIWIVISTVTCAILTCMDVKKSIKKTFNAKEIAINTLLGALLGLFIALIISIFLLPFTKYETEANPQKIEFYEINNIKTYEHYLEKTETYDISYIKIDSNNNLQKYDLSDVKTLAIKLDDSDYIELYIAKPQRNKLYWLYSMAEAKLNKNEKVIIHVSTEEKLAELAKKL